MTCGSWPRGSDCCSGAGWVSFIGWRAITFVHHLFCIHIIITIIIIISSFAFLLNCLYLSSRVFTFPPFSCQVLSCRLRLNHNTCMYDFLWDINSYTSIYCSMLPFWFGFCVVCGFFFICVGKFQGVQSS